MSTEVSHGSDKEIPSHSTLGRGHLSKGKWYCECGRAAKCVTTKKSGPNKGRKFWTCAKVYDMQCAFFLWVDHEAAAKDWLQTSQFPPVPQTPTKTGVDPNGPDSLPQLLETPFTKAKRKEVPRDSTNDQNGIRNAHASGSSLQPAIATDLRQSPEHSRKAARTSAVSTPGQLFIEKLQSSPLPLPTPNSRDLMSSSNARVSQSQLLQQRDTSPTPGRFNDVAIPSPPAESDLTTRILELIRAEHPQLKASTEMQLRHEIGLAVDVGETKLRRYEVTISELRKRVDELETMVYNLT